MSIFLIILLAVILLVVLLRFGVPLGPMILSVGTMMWLLYNPEISVLYRAAYDMLTQPRSYDLVFALYFVVCLEIELRKSGCLAGLMRYLHHKIPSVKVMMAVMPAFLGFLPSLGGARFSAPLVETAAEGQPVTADMKAAINFWFRHIFEFSSPIIPGMIMACAITGIAIGDLILHMIWLSGVSIFAGWFVMLRPWKANESKGWKPIEDEAEVKKLRTDFWLSCLPIVVAFVLMVAWKVEASVAMGLSAVAMIGILAFFKRPVKIKDVFLGALEWKLIRDVLCVLLFVAVLQQSGVLAAVVDEFRKAPLPLPVILAGISFIVGVLTGSSQGYVPIIMPIVAMLAPQGSLDLVGVALIFSMAGQMVTPTHLCLTITLNYFHADFFKALVPVIYSTAILLTAFSVWFYLTA